MPTRYGKPTKEIEPKRKARPGPKGELQLPKAYRAKPSKDKKAVYEGHSAAAGYGEKYLKPSKTERKKPKANADTLTASSPTHVTTSQSRKKRTPS